VQGLVVSRLVPLKAEMSTQDELYAPLASSKNEAGGDAEDSEDSSTGLGNASTFLITMNIIVGSGCVKKRSPHICVMS